MSVPDKRQSGVEGPGSVGPSAFASSVSQGGLSYFRWSGSFVPENVPSNELSHQYRSVKVGNIVSCRFLRQKWNRRDGILFPNLNFIDKCSSRFTSSMKLLYCWIIYLCCLWIQMARWDLENVEFTFESSGIVVARWITWQILFLTWSLKWFFKIFRKYFGDLLIF